GARRGAVRLRRVARTMAAHGIARAPGGVRWGGRSGGAARARVRDPEPSRVQRSAEPNADSERAGRSGAEAGRVVVEPAEARAHVPRPGRSERAAQSARRADARPGQWLADGAGVG